MLETGNCIIFPSIYYKENIPSNLKYFLEFFITKLLQLQNLLIHNSKKQN